MIIIGIAKIKTPSDGIGPLKEAQCDVLTLPRGSLLPLRDLGNTYSRPRVL